MIDILLSNDDGFDCVGFYPLLKALSAQFSVMVVVPDSQRSWQGKSISKKADLHYKKTMLHEFEIYTVNGTPADCIQIGLFNLLKEPPRLVVSGINTGSNAGRSRVLSSGTAGAGMEAALNGVKAVVSSLHLSMTNEEYKEINFTDPKNYHLFEPAAAITTKVVAALIDQELSDEIDLISVNIPLKATAETEFEVGDLARDGYGQIFGHDGSYFYHLRKGLDLSNTKPGTDFDTLKNKKVSITPINLDLTSKHSKDELKKLIEKKW